jgi:cytochrome c oxidase subunit 2
VQPDRAASTPDQHEPGTFKLHAMRLITTILFAALLILGVWTFVDAETFLFGPTPIDYTWWWPKEVSTFGEASDGLFIFISILILIFYVLTMGILTYCVFKYAGKHEDRAVFSHGNHKLEMLWTAVPAVLLLVIAFSQMSAWASMKFDGAFEDEEVFAEVFGSQFDWRYRYPGKDGRFGTADDIESVYELVVPHGKKLVFNLRSQDVLHSFFIPKLRFKQDAVPGMTIPIWFEIESEELAEELDNSFDIICAELCGWGHYKMSGRLTVVSEAEFDAWIDEQTAIKFSTGTEVQ